VESHANSHSTSSKGKSPRVSPSPNNRSLLIILGIMAALFVWGTLHAVGAYIYNSDIRKPFVVYAFMGGFLALWSLAIVLRNRRLRREFERLPESDADDSQPPPRR
jgi:hypothetical protein